MRKGRLNKPEIARLARAYRDLDGILDQLPTDYKAHNRDEQSVCDEMVKARNAIGVLITWQDHATMRVIEAEKAAKKAGEGVDA